MRISRTRLFVGIHFGNRTTCSVLGYEGGLCKRGIPVSCTVHVSPPLCIPTPVPSSGLLIRGRIRTASRAVTPLLLYYEPVRLPHDHLRSLSFSDCRRIPRLRGTLRASQVPMLSIRSHTADLDPGREKHILPWRCSPCCLPVTGNCRPLQKQYFGAQYLHLRCGLATPFERLHHFPLPVMVRCWCQAVGSTLPAPDFNRQEITSLSWRTLLSCLLPLPLPLPLPLHPPTTVTPPPTVSSASQVRRCSQLFRRPAGVRSKTTSQASALRSMVSR